MTEESRTLQVTSNDFTFHFTEADLASADIVRTGPDTYHVLFRDRSVTLQLIDSEASGKKAKIELEGSFYTIEIKDELEQMLDKMGFNNVSTKQIKEVRAPMPGLVLDISVVPGQQVIEGERLLILEAMKMENSISLHAAATIKNILVKKGQAVEKNQVLIELE